MTKVKVTVEVIGLSLTNCVFTINKKKSEVYFIKFDRKLKQNEVGHAQGLGFLNHNQRSCFLLFTNCVFQINLKTAQGNLINFNTMVKHNEKVCQAQNIDSNKLGQGHNHGL